MPEPERDCGCHTIYLLEKSSGFDTTALKAACVTPGAIVPTDNPKGLRPMVWHTCGTPRRLPETVASQLTQEDQA